MIWLEVFTSVKECPNLWDFEEFRCKYLKLGLEFRIPLGSERTPARNPLRECAVLISSLNRVDEFISHQLKVLIRRAYGERGELATWGCI